MAFGYGPGFAGRQDECGQFEDLFRLGSVRLHVMDDVVHGQPGRIGSGVGNLKFEGKVGGQRHDLPVQPGCGDCE